MTIAKLSPEGETMTIDAAFYQIKGCQGMAEFETPLGSKKMESVSLEFFHHLTGNHHSIILTKGAAKSLVQLINAIVSQ